MYGLAQPPPRGCVLKLYRRLAEIKSANAAASARLCVETRKAEFTVAFKSAAASARLCVETYLGNRQIGKKMSSRLRAAVC